MRRGLDPYCDDSGSMRSVEAAIRYFRARLDYASAQREGLPIGSGNVRGDW
jgi:hypothetical protein